MKRLKVTLSLLLRWGEEGREQEPEDVPERTPAIGFVIDRGYDDEEGDE